MSQDCTEKSEDWIDSPPVRQHTHPVRFDHYVNLMTTRLSTKAMTSCISALALSLSLTMVQGSILNVSFRDGYSGTGAASDTGTFWNQVGGDGLNPVNATGFKYSDGVTPASSITLSSSVIVSSWSNGSLLTESRIFNSLPNPGAGETDPFNLVISGLDNTKAYTLYLYGSYPDYATTYTVDGQSDYAYGEFSGPAFVHNTHYALLEGLTPTAGTLTIHLDHYGTSKAATISGLQLVTPRARALDLCRRWCAPDCVRNQFLPENRRSVLSTSPDKYTPLFRGSFWAAISACTLRYSLRTCAVLAPDRPEDTSPAYGVYLWNEVVRRKVLRNLGPVRCSTFVRRGFEACRARVLPLPIRA